MIRNKAFHACVAALLLLSSTNPVLAQPSPSQTTVTDTTGIMEPAADVAAEATTTVPTGELEQALVDADTAVRQGQVDSIRQELETLGDQYESLNTDYFAEAEKLASIQSQLLETQERLRWYEAELDAQRQILEERVSDIYKNGRVEPVAAIINNASFAELWSRISLLLKIGEQDAELMQRLEEQGQKIEDEKVRLDQLYKEQSEITLELVGRKKAIEDKIRQETALLNSLDEQTRAILKLDEERQRQEQADLIKRLTADISEVPQTQDRNSISLKPGTISFEALKYLGVPYVWGGENPEYGLDCSGLVKVVFESFGVNLPHFSRSQAKLGASVEYDELEPGDLVFFGNPIHHVGIYIGEGYFIHAPKRNDVVKISKLSDRHDHAGARRIISMAPSAQQ